LGGGKDEHSPMTSSHNDVQIVPLDAGVFAVHIDTPSGRVAIGRVTTRDQQQTWVWEHRDGERSSPLAASLGDVVHALANYHRNFKAQAAGAPVRRLLFG
jgi:hypothetical protein